MFFSKINHRFKNNEFNFYEKKLIYKEKRIQISSDLYSEVSTLAEDPFSRALQDSNKSQKERLEKAKLKLNTLKEPIHNPSQLRTALSDIHSFQNYRKKIKENTLSASDLSQIFDSDLSAFLQNSLYERLEQKFSVIRDRNHSLQVLFGKNAFSNQAEKEYEIQLNEIVQQGNQEDIDQFKAQKWNWIYQKSLSLQAEYDFSKDFPGEKVVLPNSEKTVLEVSKADLEEQKKTYLNQMIADSDRPLEPALNYEENNQIHQLYLNAERLRKEQVVQYLKSNYEPLKAQSSELNSLLEAGLLSKGEYEKIQNTLAAFESYLESEDLFREGSDTFYTLKRNIDRAKAQLKEVTLRLNKQKDINTLNEGVSKKIQQAEDLFSRFRTEDLKEELKNLEQQRSQLVEQGQQKSEAFLRLKQKESGLQELLALKESGSLIDPASLQTMSAEQKIQLNEDLDQILKNQALIQSSEIVLNKENRNLAQKAHLVIQQISNQKSLPEIKAILESEFGSNHFDFVSDQQFSNYQFSPDAPTKNLNDFTGGAMVFYERGDQWKIVVNQDQVSDINQLNQQLSHELYHLAFENNSEIKSEWQKRFVQSANWPDIRNQFIETFPHKTPPNGKDWSNDDILSELYAMQNDQIFKQPLEKSPSQMTSADHLNRLLWSSAAGLNQKPIEEAIRGFDDANEQFANNSINTPDNSSVSESTSFAQGEGYEKNLSELKKHKKEANDLRNSNYLQYIGGGSGLISAINRFIDDTKSLNEDLKKGDSEYIAEVVKDRIDMVKRNIKELNDQMVSVSNVAPEAGGSPVRDLLNRTRFLTPQDFWQTGSDFIRWWKRRTERITSDHAARIGTALGDNLPVPLIGEYGMEASAQKEKSESEFVNEWKSRLEQKDTPELLEIITTLSKKLAPDQDQLKAVLLILADRGRIDWRSKHLWIVINKLQTSIYISPNDKSILKNPVLLQQQLTSGLASIYDADFYYSLEKTNESNYESGKDKFAGTFTKLSAQLNSRLDQLLIQKKRGEDVDPQEYEGAIDYCIKSAKSSAEHTMFYMMIGVSEGILAPDRPITLGKYQNNWPAMDWIAGFNPPLDADDIKRLGELYFPNSFKNKRLDSSNSDFKEFYWTVIMNNSAVMERTLKADPDGWDHDWSRAIASGGNGTSASRFFAGKGGRQNLPLTAVPNVFVGSWMWFENNAKHPNRSDIRAGLTRQLAFSAVTEGIFNSVAFLGGNDTYTRGDATLLGQIPREAGMSHGDWTTSVYRDKIIEVMYQVDETFFRMIQDRSLVKTNPQGMGQQAAQYLASRYPGIEEEIGAVQTIDDIYKNMDAVIKALINRKSDKEIDQIISHIRQSSKD